MENFKLTPEQMLDNYNQLINIIEKVFTGERKDKILNMYNELSERIILTPASGLKSFHGAYPGGYIEHVLRVIKNSVLLYKTWKHAGADMRGYTEQELIFAALNHDLGKVGNEKEDHYVQNDSQWHVEKQGKMYVKNKKLSYMSIPHRSLYMLQQYDIKVSYNEAIAILSHDGVFDSSNKPYFSGYEESDFPVTNMNYILHMADLMSFRIEWETEHKQFLNEIYS